MINQNYQVCKNHGKLLQAFCENDKVPLCLNCILTQHKTHKVVLIIEKVNDQKQLMKKSMNDIDKSIQLLKEKQLQCIEVVDKLNLDYNEYVFQINLVFKNMISLLKQTQQMYISDCKRNIQSSIKEVNSLSSIIQQKMKFYQDLNILYNQIQNKTEIQYLNHSNQLIFIKQNSSIKEKLSFNYKKQELNRQKFISEVIHQFQQILNLEKKKLNQSLIQTKKGFSNFQNSNKSTTKKAKPQNNNAIFINESPSKFKKKQSLNLQKAIKQPQILQVNLLQKYQKYQTQKNIKKRNSEYIISSNPNTKSPKIQYQVKRREIEDQHKNKSNKSQKKYLKMQNKNIKNRKQSFQDAIKNSKKDINKFQYSTDRKIIQSHKISKLESFSNHQKDKQADSYWLKDLQYNQQNLSSSKISTINKNQIGLSFLNQYYNYENTQSPQNKNQTFQIETPLSIKSFMQSSNFTNKNQQYENFTQEQSQFIPNSISCGPILNQANFNQNNYVSYNSQQDSLLKDSRASFSVLNTQQKIFHIGGLRNDTIDCIKLQNKANKTYIVNNNIVSKGLLNRSKFQCIIMKNYNIRKILIIGGKDFNSQRTSSIIQFDTLSHKIQKTSFQLNQAISGFGAVFYQNKLFVFGGSSSTSSLKTMHQYKISKIGFQSKKLCSMLNSRDQLGFAMGFDGYLYACGGINNSNSILNSCQKYCFKNNKWISIPAMKNPRRSFALISMPNGIYAVGGHDGKSYLKSVQMFDYQINKWIQVASLNQGRFTHSAISTSDYEKIIVFGGFQNNPLANSQIFNIIQNKWTVFDNMISQRYLHCSIICNQQTF